MSWFVIIAPSCSFIVGNYQIMAGDHKASDDNEGTEQVRGITSFLAHENYNSTTDENDIALIFVTFLKNNHQIIMRRVKTNQMCII